jgi:hypothetical protein
MDGASQVIASPMARQAHLGDENGIIVPVKWCGLVSLSTKAWRALSLDEAEKISDRPDAIENAPNESPLRHPSATPL